MSATAEYLQQMQYLTRDHRIAVHEAQTHTDDHLTHEGLQARRKELIQRANNAHKGKLQDLRDSMDRESRRVRTAAEKAIPAAPDSTRDSWERVRMLLDAGQALSAVIAKADAAGLHAIREWAPTWLDATTNGNSTDLAPFERSITERWASLASDADPIKEYLDTAPDLAQFEHMAASLSASLEGQNPRYGAGNMADAFAAHYAGQQAKVSLATLEAGTRSSEL